MDETFCASASYSGQIACLKFLHENNYPWNNQTVINAIRNNKLDCLKYAIENGCPWSTENYMDAFYERSIDSGDIGHKDILLYLKQLNFI